MAKTHAQMQEDLTDFLSTPCPGIAVEVSHSKRWDRLCLTFRWEGFADLLLEERFRLIAKRLPENYFVEHCQGAVWLELTPGESIDEFLAQPRSEDVDDKLPAIWAQLDTIAFFAALEDELVRIPPHQCPDDFTVSKRVLAGKGVTGDERRDILLAFMRQQAYTDWEVLRQVKPVAQGSAPKQKTKKRK